MQENLLSLDDVKTHFEHWRTIRTKQRERIPQSLWDEVKTLSDYLMLNQYDIDLSWNGLRDKSQFRRFAVISQKSAAIAF